MENINYLNSPCQNCYKRKLGCHDWCGEYKGFKAKGQEIKEARTKYKNSISNIARR